MKFKSMKTAPRNGTVVVLLSKHGIRSGSYEPLYDDDNSPWKYRRFPSDGCGCCATSDEPPMGWLPMPKLEKQK